jgi:hypothetical protein
MDFGETLLGVWKLSRPKLRQIILFIVTIDFPLLYLGAVTFESSGLTVSGLAILILAAVVTTVVY